MKRRRWDYAALVAKVRSGTPPYRVAREVGCAVGTVYNALAAMPFERVRLSGGQSRIFDYEAIARLVRSGVTRCEVMRRLGCSYGTVRSACLLMGVPDGRPGRPRKVGAA